MGSVIKVAALCVSLRKASNNLGLIRAAMEVVRKETDWEMEIEYIDVSTLPMLNTDLFLDSGVFPAVVEAFRNKVLEADCFFFASPEYNYSVTAPLKNALDWPSCPPNVWADKAAAIVSASGSLGGAWGQHHLRQIAVFLDLHVINKPELFINGFEPPAKFDSNGDLIDPQAKQKLEQLVVALREFTLRLRNNS